MGNKISRRRDTQRSAETAATAEDPADTQAVEEPEVPQTQEATEEEDLDVVVGPPVPVCLPSEECTSEMKGPKSPAATPARENDVEPKPVPTESPAPIQPELLVTKSEPVVAADLTPEPEPTSTPQTEAEIVLGPISEPAPGPAEDLEQQTDMLTQETLPKPVISSPPLVDLGVADVTLQPVITPLSQAPIHNPVNADKPLDSPLAHAQAAESSMPGPEKPGETSGSLKEAVENVLVGDVSEDSVSTLLKNLELQGNDLVTDLIRSDVKMPDENTSADVCSSTELM